MATQIKEIELLEIFFLNVGQGNCTIIKAYYAVDEYHCWIFDAGSNKYPDMTDMTTRRLITPEAKSKIMAKKIQNIIGKPQTLSIILSHPDSDHTNLIFPILEGGVTLPGNIAKIYHSRFYDKKAHYSFLDQAAEELKLKNLAEKRKKQLEAYQVQMQKVETEKKRRLDVLKERIRKLDEREEAKFSQENVVKKQREFENQAQKDRKIPENQKKIVAERNYKNWHDEALDESIRKIYAIEKKEQEKIANDMGIRDQKLNDKKAQNDAILEEEQIKAQKIARYSKLADFRGIDPKQTLGWDGEPCMTGVGPIKAFERSSLGSFDKKNENSLVILIEYECANKVRKILLPGDATFETWESIKNHYKVGNDYPQKSPFGDVFLYQISHHGAEECTYPGLLNTINPELCFVSAHIYSQHDHPFFTTIEEIVKFLSNREAGQKQPWHHFAFTQPQYLHELSTTYKSWQNIVPLLMCRTTDKKRQTSVYATNLGLYSTTSGFSYCVSLARKMSEYKIDWFSLENETVDPKTKRVYYPMEKTRKENGNDFTTFATEFFSNEKIYFPTENFKERKIHLREIENAEGKKVSKLSKIEITGVVIPNKEIYDFFFGQIQNKLNLQFLDLRLCRPEEISDSQIQQCLIHLPKLSTILFRPSMKDRLSDDTKTLILEQMIFDAPETRKAIYNVGNFNVTKDWRMNGKYFKRTKKAVKTVTSQGAAGNSQVAAGTSQVAAGTFQVAAGTFQVAAGTSQGAAGNSMETESEIESENEDEDEEIQ